MAEEPVTEHPNSSARLTARSRYETLSIDREPFLTFAEDSAQLTLPYLTPRRTEERKVARALEKPWQSVGARGVNNLASKLLLALLPPNEPFFELLISDQELAKIGGSEDLRTKVENALADQVRSINRHIESKAYRPQIFEALKHLIVSGNVVLHITEDRIRVVPIDQFVVCRDGEGNILEIIVRETLNRRSLPKDVREQLMSTEEGRLELARGDNEEISLFTWVRLEETGMFWTTHQEVCGQIINGTEGRYKKNRNPWRALRFLRVAGEDYGHGFVEEVAGDLKSLEVLSQAIVEAAVQSARVLHLVRPNGMTSAKQVESAENGAVIPGMESDIYTLRLDKGADMQVAQAVADRLRTDLSFAFLMNSAIQRDAERVTAEEIRAMIAELEDSLGGIYSLLSQELQLPMVELLIDALKKAGKLAKLPEGSVEPAILTGVEAIGRTNDYQKLRGLIEDFKVVGEIMPEIYDYVEVEELVERLILSRGVDKDGLIVSAEEVQKKQAAAQQQAVAAQAGPEVIKQVTGAALSGAAAPPQ